VRDHSTPATRSRRQLLEQVARKYVVDCLGKGDFDSIPYHPEVELRAPLCPGGSEVPLRGREALRDQWWQPLPDMVLGVELLDVYVNEPLTAVAVEFLLGIRKPACKLRIVDRFAVDGAGRITSQENYFDPSVLTQPS